MRSPRARPWWPADGATRWAASSSSPPCSREVEPDMRVFQEETFGPVAPLVRFHTDAEALALANRTDLGLAAYFYARDIGRIFRVAEGLEAGIVAVNTGVFSTEVAPFGGVKQSGHRPRGVEVRHRGVPRGQIRLPRRDRPVTPRAHGMA